MKLKTFILAYVIMICALNNSLASNNKNIMLILGTYPLEELENRVNIGFKLYNTHIDFDYIIVSGGCGAHNSKICEAKEMSRLLIKKGVPAHVVIKEEKSQNTIQNYLYSRDLRKSDGTKYINAHDNLYVVSNHWHAISVAARFNMYDNVNAVYHIEGNIVPSPSDKVDYVDIYHKYNNNDDFIKNALWPSVHSSYSTYKLNEENPTELIHLFINDTLLYYASIEKNRLVLTSSEILHILPRNWSGNIDASLYNPFENKVYVFNKKEFIRFTANAESLDKGYPKLLNDWIKGLPLPWQYGSIDAAFFNPNNRMICLFKGDEYIEIPSNQKSKSVSRKKIKDAINNWPFEWGSGNLDAAIYSHNKKKIYLFRGREYVRLSLDNNVENIAPQKVILESSILYTE